MFRHLMPLALTATALAACKGEPSISDMTETVPQFEAPNLAKVAQVTNCPQDQWLGLDDFPNEAALDQSDPKSWLAANAARSDVTVSASGLQSHIVKAGLENGASPSGSDIISAHYYGYFPSGARFDDSYSRQDPLVIPNDAVISGWTEALRDMKICEARIVYIPGDLAYGATGAGPIPPNATLIFKMQLLGVKAR